MPTIAAPSHFIQLRDWSARKHEILKEYLPAFCSAISKQARGKPIWYVDGYAGAGVYRNQNNPDDSGVYGSPVLAARVTQQLHYSIQCLNIEEDKANFESLQRETVDFPHVTNIHGDFNAAINAVLETVDGSPAFFFLDSFGLKELPMEGLIDRIAIRQSPTDILLRYDTTTVGRLIGSYRKDPIRGGANARNLDKWFRGQGWRKLIEQHTGNACDEALLQHYLEQLVSISQGRLKFACAYPIRSTDGKTKYHIVFATRKLLGLKIMSDVLFKAEAKYVEEHTAYQEQQEMKRRPGQLNMFESLAPDPHIESEERKSRLKQSILEQTQQGQTHWEFDDLRSALIAGEWFAQLPEKDFRAACKELCTEGKVERISPGNAWKRETEFVIRP